MLIDVCICQKDVKESMALCYGIFQDTGINSGYLHTACLARLDVFCLKMALSLTVDIWKR